MVYLVLFNLKDTENEHYHDALATTSVGVSAVANLSETTFGANSTDERSHCGAQECQVY